MEIDSAINGRRSIRSYLNNDVSKEMIREIIKAATMAPSAKNEQQWRFTVLTGNAKDELTDFFKQNLEQVSNKIGKQNMGSSFSSCRIMEEAPVVIIVWNAGERGWQTEAQSVAAAVQNLLLKACSLGLGSLWIGDVLFTSDALVEYFGKSWKLFGAITLGWSDYDPAPKSPRTVDEVTEFLN